MGNSKKDTNKKTTSKAVTKSTSATKKAPAKQVTLEETMQKEKKPMNYMPYLLGVIALLLVLLMTMSDTGLLGKTLKPVFGGLFGYGAYAIPVYLIIIAVFWKRDREKGSVSGRCFLCVVNFIFVLTIIHIHTSDESLLKLSTDLLKDLFVKGKEGVGAGVIGGLIGTGLYCLLHTVLTLIISYIAAVCTFIFLIGTTPLRIFKAIVSASSSASATRRERENVKTEKEKEPKKEKEKEKEAKGKQEGEENKKPKKPEVIYNVEKKDPLDDIDVPDVLSLPDNGESETRKAEEKAAEEARKAEEARRTAEEARKAEEEAKEKARKAKEANDKDYESMFREADGDAPIIDEGENENGGAYDAAAETELGKAKEKQDNAAEAENENAGEEVIENTEVAAEPAEPPYVFPPITLLSEGNSNYLKGSTQSTEMTGKKLIDTLHTYGVNATLISTSRGPAVTRYEIQPDEGVRVSRIEGLSNDIRMRLAATSVRVETNIPGKAAIGIEIPNETPSIVKLRDLIDNDYYRNHPSKLLVCLGVDVGGKPIYFDIPDMPHLLIAGATGTGKSVCINSVIISLLYRAKPDEVKFIFIDPKKIELSCYNGIPHMLIPVVNEPRTAAGALNWAVTEMERRYTLMEQLGNARKLEEYNAMIEGDPEREKLPNIVIIIDELADLMITAKDAVEDSICRLAQKARAAGIYLILGTQRPSADVITGLIKANIPSRIAFTVSQSIDSRIILDENGAESLLGNGDMIFAPVKERKKMRVQGAFVDGKSEVASVCAFVKGAAQVSYSEDVIRLIEENAKLCGEKPGKKSADSVPSGDTSEDPLFLDALAIAIEFETMATSLLQRKLSVGYSRAQKMIDMMEDRGYVGKFDPATKKRKVNITREEYDELCLNKENHDA